MILPRYRVETSRIAGAGQGLFLDEPVAAGRVIVAPDGVHTVWPEQKLREYPQQSIEVESSVRWFEADGDYVTAHAEQGRHVLSIPLAQLEARLDPRRFVRIHKSFVVALDKIEKTDTTDVWIGGKSLPLGDTYKADFFERIERSSL